MNLEATSSSPTDVFPEVFDAFGVAKYADPTLVEAGCKGEVSLPHIPMCPAVRRWVCFMVDAASLPRRSLPEAAVHRIVRTWRRR